jgi:hypothetical protein
LADDGKADAVGQGVAKKIQGVRLQRLRAGRLSRRRLYGKAAVGRLRFILAGF